jgi:hypothetical protein
LSPLLLLTLGHCVQHRLQRGGGGDVLVSMKHEA